VTRPSTEVVLCVNTGSSSVKCAVYRINDDEEHLLDASSAEGTGAATLTTVLDTLRHLDDRLTAVSHRVVHGGPHHDRPTVIDATLIADLRAVAPLAPLHQQAALEAIAIFTDRYPRLPQVACFDTAFHRTMPEVSWRLPLPRALADQGVRRYGFHGLSYEYIVTTLGADQLGRAVLAHLGSGASLVAVQNGESLDTTMGLTPAGGIVMASRSGDLDPGVLVYLARELGYDPARLEQLVEREAGLLGLSGTSGDMRALLECREAGDQAARMAIAVYCTRIGMQIGAYAARLGGLDTVVFTGGVGAHAPAVRTEACAGLEHLGVTIDAARNAAGAPTISSESSSVAVRVLETDENVMLARHARAALATQAG
jgi:acetate kinase